ncbi:MAG: transposase [Phycisphaerae bacterium]|nr:transposase [Phycisphaerae bacterium]
MYNKPLAYFITFTTYGTWLHGDSRKSILVKNGSTKLLGSNKSFFLYEQQQLKESSVTLDKKMREAVFEAIVERCLWKEWQLYATHVRSNHAHILVSSTEPMDKLMTSFKAWATRKLRQHGYNIPKVWTQHGSTKYVFTKTKLFEKINYVIYEQGKMMEYYIDPEFEQLFNKSVERKRHDRSHKNDTSS